MTHPSSALEIALCATLVGCGPQVAAQDEPQGTTGSSEGSSSEATSSTTVPSASDTSDASGSSSTGSTSTGSTSGVEPWMGPGCEEQVHCTGESIEGSIRIQSEADLQQLRGATSITGHLEISDSDLVCLDALSCLTEVGGTLRIQNNVELRSTAGLGALASLGDEQRHSKGLIITGNPQLEVLEGMPIEVFRGSLLLWRNESLESLDAFLGMQALGTLSVQDNPALTSLQSLHGLASLEECNVTRNPTLCLSEIYAVCQNAEDGEVVLNDDSC